MIYNQELAGRVASYVTSLYRKFQTPELVYHNLTHTQKVFEKVNGISAHYSIKETDMFVLSSAAWFHDCGHLFGPATDHEVKSIVIMRSYMEGMGMEEKIIELTGECILSTRLPNDPKSIIAEILCDADLYHLGTGQFLNTDELVRKEFELRNGFLPPGWDESTLSFLESHTYFTTYCQALLEKGKLKNIALMRERLSGRY